jgi:hypothetical protein
MGGVKKTLPSTSPVETPALQTPREGVKVPTLSHQTRQGWGTQGVKRVTVENLVKPLFAVVFSHVADSAAEIKFQILPGK